MMLKSVKLLLLAIAVLMVGLVGTTVVHGYFGTIFGVVAVGAFSAVLVVFGILVSAAESAARTGRAWAVLRSIEQAVRLNLPLPGIVAAIGEGERGKFARTMEAARQALLRGDSLAVVLAELPWFTRELAETIAAAEHVGRLPQVLSRIVERRREMTLRGMGRFSFYTIYAPAVCLALIGIASMLVVFVMPKFEAIFADFHIVIPRVTAITIQIYRSPNIGVWALLLVVGLNAWILAFSLPSWQSPMPRITMDGILGWIADRLPWIGTIRFNRALGDALDFTADAVESGRTIESSLGQAAQISGNTRLGNRFDQWIDAITQGESLSDAARRAGMPSLVCGMLATAVQTPDLAAVLHFLGRYYATRFNRAMLVLEATSVPLVVIAMGSLVAWIALTIFVPMTALIQTVIVFTHLSGVGL